MTPSPQAPVAIGRVVIAFGKFFPRLCIVLLLGLPFADASASAPSELMSRQLILHKIVALFQTDNFRELNRLSKQYRDNGERTSSGIWKLSLFYASLASVANKNIADEEYWNQLEAKTLKWVDFDPGSPAAHLAYANFLISHAWMYRGNAYASEVREEDWKPFYDTISKARNYLEAHKQVASKDPRWYELMIIISMAQGWDLRDFNTLTEEATARYPYFYQIYFAAIDYLTPKWHGSKEEIELFARTAVALTRKEEGDSMYSRIYWYASQTNYGNSLFTDSIVVWSMMSKSIDDVLRRYPDQWNINNFAHFACLSGDAEKTRQLIAKIDGKPIIEVWGSMRFFNACNKSTSPGKGNEMMSPSRTKI